MRGWLCSLAASAFCLFLCGPVLGQEKEKASDQAVVPAYKLIGMNVKNAKGESLGHIEDLVIRMKDGRIAYAALSRGKVLGFGGNLFAIAPEALTLAANREHFVLEASEKDFENAKGFDQNNWPAAPDRRWGKTTDATEAAAAPQERRARADRPEMNEDLARVSAINGLGVTGRDDKSLGRIYGLAVDWSDHRRVVYAAIHYGGTAGIGGKLIAVAWDALAMKTPTFEPQRRVFFLNATQQDMENATGFTSDSWPAQPDARFQPLRRAA